MISWISKTFSSVKITPENNAISIDNQQIKLLNPYQKREHRTGHPTKQLFPSCRFDSLTPNNTNTKPVVEIADKTICVIFNQLLQIR